MRIAAYGGGTNSTALIIECFNRGIAIDHILFADTGAEKPHTYEYVKRFSAWCVEHALPEIITVRKAGNGETLEQECLRKHSLPSLAYGFKTCSQKFKIQPQDMFFNNLPEAKKLWKNGERVIKLIGYDSNEAYRKEKALLSISDKDAGKYDLQFPLIDWKLTREDCVKIIKDAGLCLAGKSACYFCPASKVSEIKQLEANYPELLQRALDLEANAELTRIKGLGNSFSWREAVKTTDIFADQFSLQPEMICGCYDG
jgi:hypothetical protein